MANFNPTLHFKFKGKSKFWSVKVNIVNKNNSKEKEMECNHLFSHEAHDWKVQNNWLSKI